jgi:hypothetical protein
MLIITYYIIKIYPGIRIFLFVINVFAVKIFCRFIFVIFTFVILTDTRVVRGDEFWTYIKSIVWQGNRKANRNMSGFLYNNFDWFNYHILFFIAKHLHAWTTYNTIWKMNSLLFYYNIKYIFVTIQQKCNHNTRFSFFLTWEPYQIHLKWILNTLLHY